MSVGNVHYKFKSSNDYDTVTFDAAFISLGDLKRQIIQQKKLGKGTDFDLKVTNAQTNEEYEEDSTLVPKNTSVIVRRVPATKPNTYAQGAPQKAVESFSFVSTEAAPSAGRSEEDQIKDMVSNQAAGWHSQSGPRPRFIHNTNYLKKPGSAEQKIPPPTYVCHRCNQVGHYINNCPTNGDPTYDFHKVKKPTGIPRMFLKAAPAGKTGATLMMPGGGFAVMQPNSAEFDKIVQTAAPTLELKNIPTELQCPLCKGLLRDAVLIPCCGNSFCDECIRNSLLESSKQLACPMCQKTSSPDLLFPNMKLRVAVDNFQRSLKEQGVTESQDHIPQPSLPAHHHKDPRPPARHEPSLPPPPMPSFKQERDTPRDRYDPLDAVLKADSPPNSALESLLGDLITGPTSSKSRSDDLDAKQNIPLPFPSSSKGGGGDDNRGGRRVPDKSCYNCGSTSHVARDCLTPSSSSGPPKPSLAGFQVPRTDMMNGFPPPSGFPPHGTLPFIPPFGMFPPGAFPPPFFPGDFQDGGQQGFEDRGRRGRDSFSPERRGHDDRDGGRRHEDRDRERRDDRGGRSGDRGEDRVGSVSRDRERERERERERGGSDRDHHRDRERERERDRDRDRERERDRDKPRERDHKDGRSSSASSSSSSDRRHDDRTSSSSRASSSSSSSNRKRTHEDTDGKRLSGSSSSSSSTKRRHD